MLHIGWIAGLDCAKDGKRQLTCQHRRMKRFLFSEMHPVYTSGLNTVAAVGAAQLFCQVTTVAANVEVTPTT